MSYQDIVEVQRREDKAAADALLINHAHFKDLPWPQQMNIIRLLDRVGCEQEGPTAAIANAKRKPYWDLCKKLNNENARQVRTWINQVEDAAEDSPSPKF